MKILYDGVSSEYRFPLSKGDIGKVRNYIPSEIWNAIRYTRFGFSAKSSRAGRTVKRGRFYSIRVNFCLKQVKGNLESPILFDDKRYIENLKKYGGKPNLTTSTVDWQIQDAKRYAFYILLHEIGHIVYAEEGLPGGTSRGWRRGCPKEEEWCDNYSAQLMHKMGLY